jgi:undecaprenyl-diphosphatase
MPSASESLIVFATGMLTSAITGYLAIRWLLRYLTRHRLYVVAVYCGIIGILTLAVSLIRL